MIPVMCLVQQGQISQNIKSELISEINAFTQKAFNSSADIDWLEIANGNGFTAAKLSRSVITSMQLHTAINQNKRKRLLKEFSQLLVKKTGCSPSQIMTAIRDPQS